MPTSNPPNVAQNADILSTLILDKTVTTIELPFEIEEQDSIVINGLPIENAIIENNSITINQSASSISSISIIENEKVENIETVDNPQTVSSNIELENSSSNNETSVLNNFANNYIVANAASCPVGDWTVTLLTQYGGGENASGTNPGVWETYRVLYDGMPDDLKAVFVANSNGGLDGMWLTCDHVNWSAASLEREYGPYHKIVKGQWTPAEYRIHGEYVNGMYYYTISSHFYYDMQGGHRTFGATTCYVPPTTTITQPPLPPDTDVDEDWDYSFKTHEVSRTGEIRYSAQLLKTSVITNEKLNDCKFKIVEEFNLPTHCSVDDCVKTPNTNNVTITKSDNWVSHGNGFQTRYRDGIVEAKSYNSATFRTYYLTVDISVSVTKTQEVEGLLPDGTTPTPIILLTWLQKQVHKRVAKSFQKF